MGPWDVGVSWRLQFRRWQYLIDAVRRSGYEKSRISICLFGDEKGSWFRDVFEEAGVKGGVVADDRRKAILDFEKALSAEEEALCFGL